MLMPPNWPVVGVTSTPAGESREARLCRTPHWGGPVALSRSGLGLLRDVTEQTKDIPLRPPSPVRRPSRRFERPIEPGPNGPFARVQRDGAAFSITKFCRV